MSWFIALKLWFVVVIIAIVIATGVYKPTYNPGAINDRFAVNVPVFSA